MSRRLLAVLLVLSFTALACGFRVNVPIETKSPGPDVTETISVPVPGTDTTRLSLAFGAGKLFLSAGPGPDLVSGTAIYNLADFKPEIKVDGPDVRIEQGAYTVKGLPSLTNIKNEWDLKLGGVPMELSIEAGAYEARYDFGGLSLVGLTIKDGASDVNLKFSTPNTARMDVLRYETGASNVIMGGLSNANFSTMILKAGAGNYTLNFSGDLQREATVTIESGLSNITLVVPDGITARVTVEGGLSNVSSGTGWVKNGDVYTVEGSSPALTFIVKIGAGNLTLTR